ncbi:Uncharacterised protein [Vibrio cholerae]|nr:Uncharacterised protein [Vibrio cholerae]
MMFSSPNGVIARLKSRRYWIGCVKQGGIS